MGKTLIVLGLFAASLLLAGCSCCAQGGPRKSENAACRGGSWPCWPLEGNHLGQTEPQLTPALNKSLNCPGHSDGFCYTKLPWKCDTRYDR